MSAQTQFLVPVPAQRPFPARGLRGTLAYRLLGTTDHKLIGVMYVVTCFGFFFVGGLMALLMRAELVHPGLQFLSNEQYNQLFTMHGTVMLLFYATPIVSASPIWCCRCISARQMWLFRA
ncbi:Probable cytochrome c oxidase subunit I [Mycobacteroides abscessus]|nr:Probable cytochrome c oxidase subunit I [Mycobacteroides abscessus]